MKRLNYKRNFLIGLSFILFAIFSALWIALNNKLYITNDSLFHSGRLLELIRSRELLPRYAFNSFNFDGSAVMTMYPYLFLYPIVIIFKGFGSIKAALLINFILITIVSLIINYFSSLSYDHNWLISYLFAIIYALSGEATAMYFYSPFSDLGVYFSYLFLPLVIFGFLDFLKAGHWVMLSIGMSLIMYSNVISVAFITGLLLIWYLCNIRLMTKARWIVLIKAILLTMLTTAALWIPMLRLMMHNHLRVPSTDRIMPVSLLQLTKYALRNSFVISCQNLTFFSLTGVIMGLLFFKVLSYFTKQLYVFAIFIILLSSKLFPWSVFSRNYLLFKWVRSIQTTVRMMVIPQLILEFVLAVVITRVSQRHANQLEHGALAILILALGVAQVKIQHEIITQPDTIGSFQQVERQVIRSHVMDYWPISSVNQQNRQLIYHSRAVNDDNQQSTGTYHLGHGYYYFNNRQSVRQLSLPVFYYYGTPYQVSLDDRSVHADPAHHQLLTIHHVKPGRHRVHITVPVTMSTRIARILTAFSLCVYVALLIERRKRTEN